MVRLTLNKMLKEGDSIIWEDMIDVHTISKQGTFYHTHGTFYLIEGKVYLIKNDILYKMHNALDYVNANMFTNCDSFITSVVEAKINANTSQ